MPYKDPVRAAEYHKAYEAKRRGTRKEYMAAWREAHLDEMRAYDRARVADGTRKAYAAKHRAAHREERNAAQRDYTARRRAEDPTYSKTNADYLRAYRAANRDRIRILIHRYRERALDPSVTWTTIQSDECGVCHKPLHPEAVWPDPMATTLGHEPPVSRIHEGFTHGVRRPEHWVCNRVVKHARLDSEITQAA